MTQMRVKAKITESDFAAAMAFIDKRVRRHDDIMDGFTVALCSVMYITSEFLKDSGMLASEVDGVFDQFKVQVSKMRSAAPVSQHN